MIALATVFLPLALLQGGGRISSASPPTSGDPFRWPGVCFSPWVAGEDPNLGATITPAELERRMRWITADTRWIRTFGVDGGLEAAGAIAHALGLKAAIGAWLNGDPVQDWFQIARLVDMANAGEVDVAIVGSEALLRGDLTAAELISYLQWVRGAIPTHVPVTTSEVYFAYLQNPSLVQAVDLVACHVHPYWEGTPIEQALSSLDCRVAELRAAAGGKPIWVTETGWPDCGQTIPPAAVPSPANAARYFQAVASWAAATQTTVFWFSAMSEPFKALYEGPSGACWGYRDTQGSLKPGRERAFYGGVSLEGWSIASPPGGPGTPELDLLFVPPIGSPMDLRGRVLHVEPFETRIAVYIQVNGGYWTKPFAFAPLTAPGCDGTWITDITTGGIDEQATRVAAFLLPTGVNPPILLGAPSLPATLFPQALDFVEVVR